MKKFTHLLAGAALLGLTAQVQAQGTRNNVVLEVFTGTWCQYCPGAAMGVEDLLLNGKKVAPVKFHIGDGYETAESVARDAYYAVGGYPTSEFDGLGEVVGGSTSTSIYGTYLPEYNSSIGAATPFNVSASSSLSGDSLTVIYTVEQVGMNASANLRSHVVVTESNIPDVWLAGLTEVDFVMRKMAPDQNGTAFTLTQGNTWSDTLVIVLAPGWVKPNLELVVFVQDNSTKEIFNSHRGPLTPSTLSIDPVASNFQNPFTGSSCENSITPELVIYNNGNTTLTSLDINYNLNGTPGTFNWTGSLPYYTYAIVTLPTLNFTVLASNSLTISVSNPNMGATDEDGANNNFTTNNWTGVTTTYQSGNYTLELQLDEYGSETTWEFYDINGNVTASGGPYTNSNPIPPLITEVVPYAGAGCVKFRIIDSYGDGICCGYGQGYFNVFNANGTLILNGSNFGSGTGVDWVLDPTVKLDNNMSAAVNVFPTPTTGRFTVNLGENVTGESRISIMSIEGKAVLSTVVEGSTYEANITDQASGMYMVRIENANGVAVKKVTKE